MRLKPLILKSGAQLSMVGGGIAIIKVCDQAILTPPLPSTPPSTLSRTPVGGLSSWLTSMQSTAPSRRGGDDIIDVREDVEVYRKVQEATRQGAAVGVQGRQAQVDVHFGE
jgi:hypothetical protein